MTSRKPFLNFSRIISRFLCERSECKSLDLNPFRVRKKFRRIASPSYKKMCHHIAKYLDRKKLLFIFEKIMHL